jgi:beta-alanine--pyruvate transaminase
VRNLGLVAGIELSPRAGAPGARAGEVFQKCFDSGLMVRYTGDIIAVSPPLIIDEAQIGQIFDQIGKILKEVA